MPRVRWSMPMLCLLLNFIWIVTVRSDCWFENRKHSEGDEVETSQPCLNCTCKQGALVCYLRICSELPNPPPPGCIILHKRKDCCPELVCTEISPRLSNEARSEPDLITTNEFTTKTTCMENGTIYGPGSAMSSSTFCEYCFCIKGQQTCIKPKCMLNLDGCSPVFEDGTCCPSRYNCSGINLSSTSTTTTQLPEELVAPGGCLVASEYYTDGSKVLGVGHSDCDNCYCLQGLLRCEPQHCAPPILGCSPVIKPGECCASSYNCNGTIEIQPEPYYGNYPTISKEYSKFRKEVQQLKPLKVPKETTNQNNTTFYVIAESSPTSTTLSQRYTLSSGTTRRIDDENSRKPPKNKYSSKYRNKDTTSPDSYLDVRARPSTLFRKNFVSTNDLQKYRYNAVTITTKMPRFTEPVDFTEVQATTPKQVRSSDYEDLSDDVLLSIVDSLFSDKVNSTTEQNVAKETTFKTTTQEPSTTPISVQSVQENLNQTKPEPESLNFTNVISTFFSSFTNEIFSTTDENNFTTVLPTTTDGDLVTTTEKSASSTLSPEIKTVAPFTMVTTLVTTTDCVNSTNSSNQSELKKKIDEEHSFQTGDLPSVTDSNELSNEIDGKTPLETFSTTVITTEKDITIVDLESKVKVDSITTRPLNKTPTDIEAILNISLSKNKDYDDYDYNEPTLPPSLPNLRIIPFVAADALDAKGHEIENSIYALPLERRAETPSYSLFSPPTETEGGFMPKEPILLPSYYESNNNNYHTTRIVDITSATPLPLADLLITPTSNKRGCLADNREFQHGETVTAKDCIICVCFYGNTVCQKSECPTPGEGCRREKNETNSCCPQIICDPPSEHNLLDRIDVTSNPNDIITAPNSIESFGLFKDLLTDQPPNLLDDKPYFINHATTERLVRESTTSNKPNRITTTTTSENPISTTTEEFSLGKVWDLLFYGETTTEKKVFPRTESPLKLTAQPLTFTTTQTTTPYVEPNLFNNVQSYKNNIDSAVGVGLLKLAGCNIYGRMYRVGRIISELSGPCLECKCTEVGVQCTPLKC